MPFTCYILCHRGPRHLCAFIPHTTSETSIAMAMAAALLLLLLSAPAVFAEDHTVGGNSGWDSGVDYTTWATGKTFTIGDNLVFTYGAGTHSVDQVSKDDYDNCATSNPIKTYNGGSNTVPLTAAGAIYFLCPTPGHCSQGMKLAITVVAASGTPSPPSGSTSPSPPPPTATSKPSPPPPSGNGATSKFCNIGQLMVGIIVGFGVIFGLMV